ncbi:MAG TPA: hypothetical protein VGE74_12115 [Gemmata sp.]
MATFRVQLFFPVDDPVACAEIVLGHTVVASVYERPDGWQIDLYESPRGLDLGGFLAAVASAKVQLGDYPNRRGESAPEGLTAAGLSLWLTEQADGTTLADRTGQRPDAEPGAAPDTAR